MNDTTLYLIIALILIIIGFLAAKKYPIVKAEQMIRKMFLKNILNSKNIDFNSLKSDLGFKVLKIQAGIYEQDKEYLHYQKLFMDNLTEAEKSEFISTILNDKFTAQQLVQVGNGWSIGIYDIEFVLGLFSIPNEKKQNFNNLLKEYFVLEEKDSEKRSKQRESKSLVTNFGFCPKCTKKISSFARKCPYCTADLD